MENDQIYDWQGNLNRNILMLQVMGLFPKGDTYKFDLYGLYSFVLVGSCVMLHISSMAISVYFLRDDLKAAVSVIYILLMSFLAICKTFFIIKNMRCLKERIIDIRSEWFQPRNMKQIYLIEPTIKLWKLVFSVFRMMVMGSNIFWAIYPIMDDTEEKSLPFPAWYPFDYKTSPFYEMVYGFQVISTLYLSFLHINIDCVIAGFNVYIASQFDILSDNLRNFGDVNNNVSMDLGNELVKCITHHKHILNFAHGCYQYYKWIICFVVIMTGLCVGMTILQSSYVVPFTTQFYSLLTYGAAVVIQIFMYCWFGNEVEVKSNIVSYAAFESNWTDLPQELKKDLLFFIMNILKPMKVSAFNLFHLSLDTFMGIMKASWSYFMLLNQF